MGVAFVTGMQGDDPHYYRVISTPKHYRRAQRPGAHAPHGRRDREQARRDGHLSARVSRRGRRGQGRFGDVRLQQHQRPARLRQPVPARRTSCAASGASRATWSPTAARCIDIFSGHHYEPSPGAGRRPSACKRGMDNECVDFTTKVTDDHDYKPYLDAVQAGLSEGERHRHGARSACLRRA